jgi:C_GCAxxG_C_C family probable redox protein
MIRTSQREQGPAGETDRRRFVQLAAAGIGVGLGARRCGAGKDTPAARVLKRGDHVDIGHCGEQILKRAYELGHQYEKRHGNCAQCTVAALQDALPFVAAEEAVFRAASCLDGGATPTGTQNCGSFTGAGIVIGHLCVGRTRQQGEFRGDTKLSHELIRKVYERFKEQYGTVLCRDVKKGAEGDCPKVVARAAQWTAEVLLEQFTGYQPEDPKQ